jgi:predicted ATPase
VIKTVRIENFRCIRSAKVSLEPFTVLVGANGSGKSSFLAALDPNHKLTGHDQWQRQGDAIINIRIHTDKGVGTRSAGNPDEVFAALAYQRLHLDLKSLRSANQVKHETALQENGQNLSNVFATLSRRQQAQVAEQLCRWAPMFADVDVRPIDQAGHHRLAFQDRWRPSVWYTPDDVSDGTMLVCAYLTLQYQDPSLDLLAVEEPERGLHPYLLGQLVALLRAMAFGQVGAGRPVQVVVATHSAELLEFARPEEVLFFSRNLKDGTVTIGKADPQSADLQAALREYGGSLAGTWLAGGLGGVP